MQTLCTLCEIGWKCVHQVCKCTLCADFVCRLFADLKWFSEKVFIKSACADVMQTFGIYCADFVHTIEFFSSWFLADIVLEQCQYHTCWPNLVPWIKTWGKDLDWKFMHTLCTLILGVCTPCAHYFWVHAHFFQTLKKQPFSPSCTGSFRIPVSLIGLITSPTSLDRNS
jgi:hypothetical protein